MSETKKQAESVEMPTQEQTQFNPFLYGYEGDVNVSIPGNLLVGLIDFVGAVANKETQERLIIAKFDPTKDVPTQMQSFKREVIITTSEIGEQAADIMQILMDTHKENADKGVAKMMNPGGLIVNEDQK